MKYTGDNSLQLTDTKPGTDKQMAADPEFLLYYRAFLLAGDSCVIRKIPAGKWPKYGIQNGMAQLIV